MADRCAAPAQTRRRAFWTTQPAACGDETSCGADCGTPGLQYVDGTASCGPPGCDAARSEPGCPTLDLAPRTFATNDWLRSLVINMLLTDGRRPNTRCGYRPGAQGGHWSESYRTDGLPIGTLMRTVDPSGRIADAVNLVRAHAQSTLSRLISLGVAHAVDVEAKYLGNNQLALNVIVTGPAGDTARVGLSGQRLTNEWVWR